MTSLTLETKFQMTATVNFVSDLRFKGERLQFCFVDENSRTQLGIGSLKLYPTIQLTRGDTVVLYGDWVPDIVTGEIGYFLADHIEKTTSE